MDVNYLLLVINDKFLSTAFATVFAVTIVSSILFGKIVAFVIFGSFVVGGLWMYDARKRNYEVPSLWPKRVSNECKVPPFECRRCKTPECDIHTKLYCLCPWRGLMVSQEVDTAIEDILNKVLQDYVYTWYKNLSCDEIFVQELRVILRHVIAALIKRVQRVNLAHLITGKVIHIIAQHLDFYVRAKRLDPGQKNTEKLVLSSYGPSMHVALKSRSTELQYLRKVVEKMLTLLIPGKYYHSLSAFSLIREILSGTVLLNGMDVIADPDIINHVLLIFFDKTPMQVFPKSKKSVELLSHFVNQNAPTVRCSSAPDLDLQTLIKSQELYSGFAHHLKDEGCQHLLWFYEALEDFNSRLLTPDISAPDIFILHQHAANIYHRFISEEALDRVPMDAERAAELQSIILLPKEQIIKLRTSTVLYEAYDDVYHLLDKVLVPQFLQSERYFAIVCKERDSNVSNHYTAHAPKAAHLNVSGARVGNATFWTALEGAVEGAAEADEEAPTQFEQAVFSMHDDPRLKDLSAWRVSIPRIQGREDNREGCYYLIDVRRIDVKDVQAATDYQHWAVGREYNEFYVLEAKLEEFHGELPIQPLPPKRSFGTRRRKLLEEYHSTFERYIQELLTLPALRGSELIYRFLKVNNEFTVGFLPDMKFGKMIRNVPRKLVREKGQHLEEFLNTFLASTETSKVKPSIVSKEGTPTKQADPLKSSMFGDNASNYSFCRLMVGQPEIPNVQLCIYDYVIYLTKSVFCTETWVTTLLRALAPLLRYTLQDAVESILDDVLMNKALVPKRMALLVNLLQEAVFDDEPRNVTTEDRKRRSQQVHDEMKEFLPSPLVSFLTKKCNDIGADVVHDIIQHPLLNKQLSYVLLDALLLELFPEFE